MSLVIEVMKPSRLCNLLVTGMHAAAALSFLLLPEAAWPLWGWPAWVIVAASLGGQAYRRKSGIRRLELLEDGGLCLESGLPDERKVVLAPSSVALARVLWLVWKEEGGRGGAAMLLADQFLPEDWRQLQRWVRLKGPARFGVEPVPGGGAVSSVRDPA